MAADPRIPLRLGPLAEAPPGAALLIEGDIPAPSGALAGHPLARFTARPSPFHPAGCACCAPRNAAAQALARLFLARARGGAWFTQVQAVTATPAGAAAVRAALAADSLTAARFRED
ncbi:MAG: hypothetical protein ACP5NP_04915 [Acetobacteraceae bacterium]